ncbi:glucose-6-phosphate isomerase [Oceanivirga miroungae]|uniref:Glucose-6-phosphate isomerase n=1 Tax=Oceanivirga miroungae TaxID=1130046 RepID=A0A6I8M8K3_9FUSO|nr:glucose-6-phosphate isomerase [Oceanivirga miroungae]VWL85813.1 glucose-6-phosphate isomerase [Oceanivirga miroungae]
MIFNDKYTKQFVNKKEIEAIKPFVEVADKMLDDKSFLGSDFLGWMDLPKDYDKEEFERIKKAALKIRKESKALVVIGIGGSYLGARAAIEFMLPTYYNQTNDVEVYFVGTNMSPNYITDIYNLVKDKDFSVNVISKSGTTTEPAIAFRIFKKLLEEKYGEKEAASRIYATTDKKKGALKTLSDKKAYETFVVPDNVGGRFSVLTAVGLLPIAAAGINIDDLMNGANQARIDLSNKNFFENDAMKYAAIRNILYRKGKDIEIFVNYEPRLQFIAEWLKQLFAESEGKDLKGIFPTSASFSTDLHSIGQAIQEGKRNIFETIISVDNVINDIVIEKDEEDLDGLNFLAGKSLDYVNKMAKKGVVLAHVDGNVPNIEISIDKINEYNLGYLFYFFEKAVAISGYVNGVNPFDQPGVEAYKKNMFALLEKPGYEEETKKIFERIDNEG